MSDSQLTSNAGSMLMKSLKGNSPLYSLSSSIANFMKILGILAPHYNSTGLNLVGGFDLEIDRVAMLDRSSDGLFRSSRECLHCTSTFKLGKRSKSRHRCQAPQNFPARRGNSTPTILWLAGRLA